MTVVTGLPTKPGYPGGSIPLPPFVLSLSKDLTDPFEALYLTPGTHASRVPTAITGSL